MSTNAIKGLRDYLCGTLTPAKMLWLGKELTDCARKRQEEYNPPIPHTLEELNAALDVAEKQFEEGKFVTNDEVKRWIRERIAKCKQSTSEDEEEQYEMPIAV